MAKGQDIKRRIKSIGSMLQVTKAMELISSIKMRKAQVAALCSKNYTYESWKTILQLSQKTSVKANPLFEVRDKGKILLVVVTSDRGLAGSYNSDVLRKLTAVIQENGLENIDFITLGRKGRDFVRKIGGEIIADFPLYQEIRFAFTSPIARIALDGFGKRLYKKVMTIHTHFESAARKAATSLQILPLDFEKLNAPTPKGVGVPTENVGKSVQNFENFIFEPKAEEAMDAILRQVVRALTYEVVLESEAAEHAARMVAMKNASDAASDLRDDFQFTFNQLRQQSITSELSEISAGVIALE